MSGPMSTKKMKRKELLRLPKVKCVVMGESNSASLLLRFRVAARKACWSNEQVAMITKLALRKSRARLVNTLSDYCENYGFDLDDEEEDR